MDAGGSAGERASSAGQAVEHLRRKLAAAEAAEARYQQGAIGEQRLAAWLDPLAATGFRLLPDRSVPGSVGNIDMIAVGPPGVFVIDAKNWTGKLQLRGQKLLQNGQRRSEAFTGLLAQAEQVQSMLRAAGAPTVPIWPILSFVGEATIAGYQLVDRVYVTGGQHVVQLLASAAPVLNEEWIDWTSLALSASCPPRTAPLDGVAEPPPESVVFLTPWFKHGKRRIYARDEAGNDGGYLDLVTGEVSGESPVAAQVLGQLLPHYLGDLDSAGLADADAAAIDRFLAAAWATRATEVPVVVGHVWRKGGLRRLYVSRLTGDGLLSSMGWYDLDDGRVYGEVQHEAEVRYSGRAYDALETERTARAQRGE